MEKFGKSQPVARREDIRLLKGEGRYVDDTAPDGALRAFVMRAPVAHGQITALDVEEARAAPGVKLVLTAEDLAEAGITRGIAGHRTTNMDGTKGAGPRRPILAEGRVRFVGEPVAFVVAESLEAAKDAAEMIELEIDELEPKIDRAPGGPVIHDEAPENLAFDFGLGDRETCEAALAGAAHVVELDVEDNRVIVNSMEARGVHAHMDGNRLHVAVNGQGVWGPRDALAKVLGMEMDAVHVTTEDVGGGFGMKGFSYPEMFLVAQASRMLGQPVRWMSERTEAMLSDNAGRDLTTKTTMGFDADHRLVAYKVESLCNLGAYNSGFAQAIQSELFAKVLPGVYDNQTIWFNCKGVYTNTTQTDAYRGAGRPEAIFVLERSMDHAARQMGIDPWELRRRNFIRPDQFPYTSATGVTYDVGEFAKLLDHVADKADRGGFAARKADSAARGKLRGMGLAYYIESILGDPEETTKVTFDEDGGASIYVGTQSNGQGHETVFPQFLSDHTGIPMEKIRFVQGDTDLIAKGGGTGGSRSVTVQNTATLATAQAMIAAFSEFLAEQEGVPASEIGFDDETFRIPGSNLAPSMLDVAQMAREAGREDLLTHQQTTKLDDRSFPNGAHVAEIEIDPETGVLSLERYTVVDDFGNLINPMLAEGQVHGGVAQGLGQAMTERVVYDETGQLLTATFMDYAMPRADDLPMISFTSDPVPSVYNPMGMKGCGEAGTVGALGAITNAVQDALWDHGITEIEMPFTPHRLWDLMQTGRGAAA